MKSTKILILVMVLLVLGIFVYAQEDVESEDGVVRRSHPEDEIPDDLREFVGIIIRRLYLGINETSVPNSSYNCHGFVFDEGTSWLEINETFLESNGYKPIDECVPPTPQPGDIVIYKHNGTITHSGKVNYTDGNDTYVKSKWGKYGDYIHFIDHVPNEDYDEVWGPVRIIIHPYGNATIYRKC